MAKGEYTDFCTELHERSMPEHEQSDKLIIVKLGLVLSDIQLYAGVLVDFYFVFKTLEEQLSKCEDHPCINGVLPEKLLRTDACKQDLEYHLGKSWRRRLRPSEAGEIYCRRIVSVAETDPTLLLAYTHSLYLALLFGGAIIKSTLQRALELPDDRGLAIYTFGPEAYECRRILKENINNLTICREMKDNIIQEKLLCYELNNSLFYNIQPSRRSYIRVFKMATAFAVVVLLLLCAIKRLMRYH